MRQNLLRLGASELSYEIRGIVRKAEQLQAFDADWVFTTYRTDRGQVPDDAITGMDDVFPGFCEQLTACREGRFIALPREEITTPSYHAVGAAIFALTAIMSNPYVQPSQ